MMEREEKHYGCPVHPNAGYRYLPLRGEICVNCGHRIALLKGVWSVNSN